MSPCHFRRVHRTRPTLSLLVFAALVSGCSERSSPTAPSAPLPPAAFVLQGDPESSQGATWTYTGTLQGTTFDLQGVLLKPAGTGPFPAVVISHGAGGNATVYSRTIGVEMRSWGLVAIATNYTHAGGVPIGSPGTVSDPGASQANVLRAHGLIEILRTLGYVDTTRVAAHGHSMGAFVTTAVLAAYPGDFRVASHTAGGVTTATGVATPSESQARAIRTPYQLHHGDADIVVPLSQDQRLDGILQADGVVHELFVYPGATHNDVAQSQTVLTRVRSWYAAHGLF
jgi:dienelactone hydrolase